MPASLGKLTQINSDAYFLVIQKIFLTGKKVRKISTLDSKFFYFAKVETYDYPITDAIRI